MEKLNDSFEKQPNEAETIADDEDEVVEEDEAEGFGKMFVFFLYLVKCLVFFS